MQTVANAKAYKQINNIFKLVLKRLKLSAKMRKTADDTMQNSNCWKLPKMV